MILTVMIQQQKFQWLGINPKSGLRMDIKPQCLFDDTIVPESPSVEPQLESPDADTEEMDIDIDKEVVLDSDDEGIQRTKMVCLVNELPSDKIDRSLVSDRVGVENRQLSPAAKQSYAGYFRRRGSKIRSCSTDIGSHNGPNSIYLKQFSKGSEADGVEDQVTVHGFVKEGAQDNMNWDCNGKVSEFMDEIKSCDMVWQISTGDAHAEKEVPSSNCEAVDGGKDILLVTGDHKFASLSYIESQEPGEPSQAKALDFVDHYLSVIDVNFSPEVERRKVTRIASPPTLCGKGSQTLARRANLRTTDGESRSFDWSGNKCDDQTVVFSRKRKEVVSRCKSHGQRSISMSQVDGNLNFKKEKDFGVQGIVQLQGTLTNENHRDSMPMALSCNEIPEIIQTTVMKSNTNSIKELDKQFGAESLGQQLENDGIERDVSDMFDIGFDTQMAAEVMETLIHAPPPDSNTCAPRAPEKSLEGSPKGETMNKASKCDSFHEGSGPEVIAKQSKRTKRPRNKISRNRFCSSHFDANKSKFDHKLSVKKKMTRGIPLTDRENIEEVDRNLISSKSVDRDLHSKGKQRGKFEIYSPIAHQTRRSSSAHSPKSIEDPPCNSGERLNSFKEVDVLERRRKSKLDSDVFRVLDMRKKCPKLGSNTHCEATNSNVNQQSHTDPFVAAPTSPLKLDFWTYPKRKRTPRNVPHHLREASDSCAPSKLVHGKNCNMLSVEIHQKSEGNSGATHLILHVNRKTRSTRQLQPTSEKKHVERFSRLNFGESNLVDVNCDFALIEGQMSNISPNDVKASCQSGKLDDVNLMSSADGAGENLKFEELPNAKLNPLPVYKGAENCKQLLKKSSSRSPLMKELSRLGFAESLPEFVSKDLRRRRNMANVQVLFSQSLDDDIIKQQRKILARLGISVASCCSEATHFITDRFVRTRNMLEAIALGKPVVTHLWLETCAQASCVIDEKKYILRDTKKEKEIGFNMSVSLARARQQPLLKGRRVFITPNVKPSKEMIESLVKAVHGQAVEKIQRGATRDKLFLDDMLILSSEQDYSTCVPFLEEGVAIYSSELLLTGIVTQKLDYKRSDINSSQIMSGGIAV